MICTRVSMPIAWRKFHESGETPLPPGPVSRTRGPRRCRHKRRRAASHRVSPCMASLPQGPRAAASRRRAAGDTPTVRAVELVVQHGFVPGGACAAQRACQLGFAEPQDDRQAEIGEATHEGCDGARDRRAVVAEVPRNDGDTQQHAPEERQLGCEEVCAKPHRYGHPPNRIRHLGLIPTVHRVGRPGQPGDWTDATGTSLAGVPIVPLLTAVTRASRTLLASPGRQPGDGVRDRTASPGLRPGLAKANRRQ